jgi:hypothetical protein
MRSKRGKIGQVSFEYMIVVALVAAVLLPTLYLFYGRTQGTIQEIDQTRIDKIGRDVIATAEKVYFSGPPAIITLEKELPKNIVSMRISTNSVTGKKAFVIVVRADGGTINMEYPSTVNIFGNFEPNDVLEGRKAIKVRAGPQIVGQPSVFVRIGDAVDCTDGTSHNACSGTQPLFCFDKVLVDDCQRCGCSAGVCQPDGTCS